MLDEFTTARFRKKLRELLDEQPGLNSGETDYSRHTFYGPNPKEMGNWHEADRKAMLSDAGVWDFYRCYLTLQEAGARKTVNPHYGIGEIKHVVEYSWEAAAGGYTGYVSRGAVRAAALALDMPTLTTAHGVCMIGVKAKIAWGFDRDRRHLLVPEQWRQRLHERRAA